MSISPDDPRLTAYALDELDPAGRQAFEAELQISPELQREVDAVRQISGRLRSELADEPCPDLDFGQRQAVLAPGRARRGFLAEWISLNFGRRPAWRPALALVVLAGLVTAALVYFGPQPPVGQPQQAAITNRLPGHTLVGTPIDQSISKPSWAPLAVALPAPTLKGTPEDLPAGPYIEPLSPTPRPDFLAPLGVRNVALRKPVTAGNTNVLLTGELAQVTDGEKEALDDQVVEMKKGLQYVQVDLQDSFRIYAVAIWHDHRYIQPFRQVIVQVADDAAFTNNLRTLFNNDFENKAGFGAGADKLYFETRFGRIVDGRGESARYVRWYSNGSHLSALNCRTEIEVYALPAKPPGQLQQGSTDRR